ncbi:MAG: polyphosphate kinase 2, partial [Corynebacterium sp.]|nr:polyphosphate kinase 2 [Corynebacterium sp.]
MTKNHDVLMPEFSKNPPKLDKKAYNKELKRLQAELVDMQQ